MKNLLVILCGLLLVTCNNKKYDIYEVNIKGNVEKILNKSYYAEGTPENYKLGDKQSYGNSLLIYDKKKNLIEYRVLDKEGNIESTSKYTYGPDGRSELITFENGKEISKTIYIYKNGNKIESRYSKKYPPLEMITKYKYAGQQLISEESYTGKPYATEYIEYEYDHNLLSKSTSLDSSKNISYVVSYWHNKNKDIDKVSIKYHNDPKESVTSFKYEYDKKGNWIKQISISDGEVDEVALREISYYGDKPSSISEKSLIGLWCVTGENDWVEFKGDRTYDQGSDEDIDESGVWELDKKQMILTFRAKDPSDSKKYKYTYENNQIILFTIQGEESMRLEKKNL